MKYSQFLYKETFCKEWKVRYSNWQEVQTMLCFIKKNTFWVRVIFVFTNINIQYGILLLIQSSETNVHDSDDGGIFKQAPNGYSMWILSMDLVLY